MVTWAPEVPNPNENTPRWGRDSNPITQFQGDMSKKYLFDGIGEGALMAVKAGDFLIKHDIDEKTRAGVEAERDAYTSALEGGLAAASAAPKGKSAEELRAQGMGNTPPPAGIDRTLGYIQSIRDGAEAGKVNDTYYKGRLVAVVKDLRSQYPGYKDYIDQKVSGITGFDPANAKISDLLTDINHLVSNKKDSEANRIAHRMEQLAVDGNEQAAILWDKMKNGQLDNATALNFIAKANKNKYDLELLQREKNTINTNDELARNTMDKWFNKYASSKVAESASAMQDGVFLGNAALAEKVRLHTTREKLMSTDELNATADLLKQRAEDLRAHFYQQARERNPQGKNMYDLFDSETINKKINENLAPLFAQVEHVRKGDLSAANAATRYVQARTSDAEKDLIDQPIFGKFATASAAAKNVYGEGVLTKFLEANNIQKVSAPIQTYLDRFIDAAAKQATTPNPLGPVTLKAQVEKVKSNADKVPAVSTTEGLVTRVEQVMNAPQGEVEDRHKLGVLISIVDPSGRGLMNEFKEGGTRQTVFNKLTSPAFAREAYRVTRNDPRGDEIWKKYEEFAQFEFGTGIYAPAIASLNQFTAPNGVRIGWNDKTKQFRVDGPNNEDLLLGSDWNVPSMAGLQSGYTRAADPEAERLKQFLPIMRQLNMGIHNIKNIAENSGREGTAVDAYVMEFLTKAGFRPNTPNASRLPEHMVNAIYHTGLRDQLLKQKKDSLDSTAGAFY